MTRTTVFQLSLKTPAVLATGLLGLAALAAAPTARGQAPSGPPEPLLVVDGISVYAGPKARAPEKGGTGSVFDGDTYSFQHQLGAMIDNIFQCFSPHVSGTNDDNVLFDGLTELLDPYLDGTQPQVFEFETPLPGGTEATSRITSTSEGTGDLFPEGFQDPETGAPLDSACVEIGRIDTLDPTSTPTSLNQAVLRFNRDGATISGPFDITSFFNDPFDGRLSIVFTGLIGLDIDTVRLDLRMEEPNHIFSDGFESGDTSSWTDEVP
ncbi:MAG: hypothetical protein AAGM22_08455 [Acidobacteriota bacterium]